MKTRSALAQECSISVDKHGQLSASTFDKKSMDCPVGRPSVTTEHRFSSANHSGQVAIERIAGNTFMIQGFVISIVPLAI